MSPSVAAFGRSVAVMFADPLLRFAPTSREVASTRAFAWRAEPPVIDEVRACPWWWMRQRGEDGYTAPHACEIGWYDDDLFFVEPGCPRVTPEEYGDGVEWMPCLPPEIGPAGDDPPPEVTAATVDAAGWRWSSSPTEKTSRGGDIWRLHDGHGRERATIWGNGGGIDGDLVWHTYDENGTGGENASSRTLDDARLSCVGCIVRQGWAPSGWQVQW